jgi:L-lysine exporter family protein LysE/ArgO
MNAIFFGFVTGLSFILAIGAQNLFVIEQGIRKNHVFLVTTICIVSDFLLIFCGIFLFYAIDEIINTWVNLLLNIALIAFLVFFIVNKFKSLNQPIASIQFKQEPRNKILFQTLAFTFLNPHVYSDTVFIIGNLSKSYQILSQKILFGLGAGLASLFFFYLIGYGAQALRGYFLNPKIWRFINLAIIIYFCILVMVIIYKDIIKTI